MSEQKAIAAVDLIKSDAFKKKIEEILKNNAPQFIASALSVISNDKMLASCDPKTVYTAVVKAASLNLPIEPNLGFAYAIGYNSKEGAQAQFQLGYKGFIQLAMRSGQVKTISVCEVYEGQISKSDPLKGFKFDFEKEVEKTPEKIVGYAAYFSLLNGFEKTLYMTKEELRQHGVKFSQTFKRGFGHWKENFDAMAKKTVLKLLISKYAPLSTQMQEALAVDQSVIREDGKREYVDNAIDIPEENEEENRLKKVIEGVKTKTGLERVQEEVLGSGNEELIALYSERLNSFCEKQDS